MYSITISPISKTFDWGSNRGFTLIELMASLVLLAMLTTIFGLGVVGALKIYAISEENVHLAQKGQMAMARINRELMELTAVIERNDDDPFIVYENLRGTGGIGIHAIRFDSANHRVLLYSDLPAGTTSLDINDDADLLLDNVADFSITYLQGSSPWTGGNQRHLSHIETRLSLLRPRGIVTNTEDFTSRVYLRNTINYGGEAPPTEPPEPPSMSNYSCFITAAAIRDNNTAVPTLLMAVFSIAIMLMVVFQCTRLYNKKTNRSSGSALIAVIVAVLMFSAIAAALLPLVSSSGQQAVAQDYSEKAYLLAESGFRYAAGQYINAGSDAEKLQVLGNLHNTAYTTDDQGRFALHLYAYFFEVQTSIPINTTSISTIVHGALPSEIEFLSNVDVSMTTGRQLLNVQNISISGNTVIFNLSTGTHHAISQGMLIYPAAVPSGSQQLSNGGSITAPHLDMFPSRNGYITVAGRRLNYRYKDMNTSPNRLVDVVDLNDPDMNLSIENTDHIVLNQHVQLVSTGFYGAGDFQVSRTVTYDTPLYFSGQTERTTTIEDTFDSAANWNSVWGANDIAEVDGNHRLDVTGESSPASSEASLMALSSEDAEQALNAAYQSSGNYLSYDTQVKVGFDDPDRLEEDTYYFAAGLSFRLNVDTEADVYNSYGVSIMRGNPNDTEDDGINDNLVPEDIENKRAIVLWRQTNNGADSAWMAYKIIEDENWPVQNATLLVRIKEAVVLRFNEGGDIPIQKGNVVVGNRSGARGRVIQGPILSNGSTWTSGATGYLLLNNNSGDFESGEELRVVGRGVLASVDSYSGDRVNIIRVYFGRSENCESEEDGGTDTPRDSTMICYPLETSPLVWPPDLDNDGAMSWPADEDYFQLVQWDVFHGVSPLVSDRELERNAIIIHHDENLQTDSDGNLGDRSEIGLHAFGNGTENIYFDDFGLQLTSQVSAVIPTPIQQ